MGLDFRDSSISFSYGSFMRFRQKLANLDNLGDLHMYKGYGGNMEMPDIPMRDFYLHSDSDGELTPEQLKVIYPRFRELIDMMKQDSHVDVYVVDKGNDLVNFIAELIANDEPLIFE